MIERGKLPQESNVLVYQIKDPSGEARKQWKLGWKLPNNINLCIGVAPNNSTYPVRIAFAGEGGSIHHAVLMPTAVPNKEYCGLAGFFHKKTRRLGIFVPTEKDRGNLENQGISIVNHFDLIDPLVRQRLIFVFGEHEIVYVEDSRWERIIRATRVDCVPKYGGLQHLIWQMTVSSSD